MPKPYQSKLIPYEAEIVALRATRPPTSYARIAQILREKHALLVHRDTIQNFVRVRSNGKKVSCFARLVVASSQDAKRNNSTKPTGTCSGSSGLPATTDPSPKPRFNYTPSDRYNLTRMTPEQIAAREKKRQERD